MDQVPVQAPAVEHEAMLLKGFAMIRGNNDDRVLKHIALLEFSEKVSDFVIYEGNGCVIGICFVLYLIGGELHIGLPIKLVQRSL